jgi:AraC-like DNA-binding protein
MELFTEYTLWISSLIGVILIGLLPFNLLIKKKQHVAPEWGAVENLSNAVVSFDRHRGQEEENKSKGEDILQQFNELELVQKLHKLLIVEKIYLQKGLTVAEFAIQLGVQARVVTQILGELYGHTFKELINMYRAEYVKERIEDGFLDQYTLKALGQEQASVLGLLYLMYLKKK